MTEYLALLPLAESPDCPLWARRTLVEALRRAEPYMDKTSWLRFQQVKAAVRAQLGQTIASTPRT